MAKIKASKVTIYFNADKTSFQVIEPDMDQFQGDWNLLVHAVTNGVYDSYVLS